jgi:3'-phosphoadenosine 5'-phosphosulfate sulfotransferase (PAPS reductase)/FAD synthetase
MKKLVGISGGKDSTAMALRLQEVEPDDYIFAITPTKRELPEMAAHWEKLEGLLGKPLTRLPGPSMDELINRFKMLPNFWARWCTRMIKIEPFMEYAKSIAPCITYIGIRADEEAREGTNWKGFENIRQDFPFQRWGWTLDDVQDYLKLRGVTIPKRTDCDICFYQRLIEWFELWRDYPELWKEGEEKEAATGHTFRSPQRDSWPAAMKDLRAEFERGRVPKETRNRQRKTMCSWCAR